MTEVAHGLDVGWDKVLLSDFRYLGSAAGDPSDWSLFLFTELHSFQKKPIVIVLVSDWSVELPEV